MEQTIQLRDILQSLSLLIAAGSVAFAIVTYKRNRVTQQITALRTALGESRREIDTLSALFTEAGACQVGVAISKQLEHMFGNSLTVEELSDLISDKANYDIIITAINVGFAETSVSSEIDEAVDKFTAVDVNLRTLAPNTSFILSSGHRIVSNLVRLVYATGHLKQVFDDDGGNIDKTVNSIRSKPNLSLAYADLADTLSVIPVQMMKAEGRAIFTQARKLIDVPTDKLMALTDDELRRYFKDDKSHGTVARDVSSISNSVSTASQILDKAPALFSVSERDEMIRAVAQLDVLIKKFFGPHSH